MKKFVVFMVAVFLVLSFSSFIPDQPRKKPQSARIENNRKKNARGSLKPRKSRSRKGIHKSKFKRPSQRAPKNNLKL